MLVASPLGALTVTFTTGAKVFPPRAAIAPICCCIVELDSGTEANDPLRDAARDPVADVVPLVVGSPTHELVVDLVEKLHRGVSGVVGDEPRKAVAAHVLTLLSHA